MFHAITLFWFDLVRDWGYGGIVLLMAMESSIFPVPSEIVVPPAAYWAAEGKMSFWGVVIAGTVGSWIGAALTYLAARWLGRAAIARWGHLFLCPPAKVDRAERLLKRYEAGGVFFSRLLPVVRHLIGIPAGIIRMPFLTYSLVTVAGAFIWCWVLAWLGQRIGERHPGSIADPERFLHAVKAESLWIVAAVGGACLLYFLMLWLTAAKRPHADAP